MGLDVTAYQAVKLLRVGTDGDEPDYDSGERRLWLNSHFPGRADEFVHRGIYRSESAEFHFRAGSYSGYNEWRDQLAKLAGYPMVEHARPVPEGLYREPAWSHAASVWNDPQPGPFVELINFSDCEGVIGTAVSAKLAKDFAEYQERADAHEDDYFREKYADWRKAFELAADGGCVELH